MTEIVRVPFHGDDLLTVEHDGRPHVILKPAVERLGLKYSTQVEKLRGKSWATCVPLTGIQLPDQQQRREVLAVDVRTFLMLLATIDERRVSADARPLLVAYQAEVADAIEQYWTQGGAINPRATADQLDTLAARTRSQLEAIGVAKKYGLVNDSYLEGVSRTLLARMTGEEPQVDPEDVTITCQEYLEERGVTGKTLRSARTRLGKAVAERYRLRYGQDPQKIKRLVDGVHLPVAVYTHRDLDLFHAAWAEVSKHYLAGGAR